MMRFLVCFLALVVGGLAQINTATLLGIVTDPSGAVVVGATITVTNVQTKVVRTATTNDAGAFDVPLLLVGEYTIAAESPGFKRAERTGIVLNAGQKLKVDFGLEVGQIAERITVSEAATLLSTQTAERGVTIQSWQIDNLPLNGRNIAQLIALEPGIQLSGQIGGAITFNGLPYQGTTINIDGTDAANPDRPTTTNYSNSTRMNLLSQDFVQEFKTTVGVYSAEIGRASAGSVNVITKSGTNDFHGSLYEFVRNDKLDARTFFATRKDPLRLNEFGGTLGGPIVHNKLFFFGGWEGVRERRFQQITGVVPTQLFRDQLLASTQDWKRLLDLIPPPTESLAGETLRGFHRRSDARRAREDIFMGRLDWAPSSKDTLFARYTIFDSLAITADLLPANGRRFPSQDRTFTASWARVLSPRILNDIRVGANKQDLPRMYAAYVPGQIGTLQGYLSTSDLEFLRANGGSHTLQDNVSYIRGRHSIKTGLEIRLYHYGRANNQAPIYFFDTAQDLLANRPRLVTSVTPVIDIEMTRYRTDEFGFYFQDDFRVRPNLTVNLGLRYEYYTPGKERDGRGYNVVNSPFGPFRKQGEALWNPDRNNFGPRFGLAWDINGQSQNVVRLGAGVFYNDNMLRHVSLLSSPPDRPLSLQLNRADFPNLRYPVDVTSFDPARFPAPLGRTIEDPNHRTSYAEQWSLDYERAITPHLAASIGYIGNRGVKLQQIQFLNQMQANGQRPYPAIGQIRFDANNGSSVYHALQMSLKKRYSHGLTFNAHYTYGKSLTYGGSEEGINDLQDPECYRCSRSRTTLSLEHIVSVNYGYDLPLGRLGAARSGAGKALLQGWRINGITSLRTGFPLNITSGRDGFGSGQQLGQRPDYVGGDIRAGTDDYRTSNLHNYINRAPFVQNNRGQYGTLGGYILTGPGQYVWDFSVFKNTGITERATLQFRTEFFNLFNHANFSNPNSNLNSGTFGRITGTGAARELQFGLKLLF